MSERYKGFIVDPRADDLADGSGWTAEVYVGEDADPETPDHRFVLPGKFSTRDAALAAAIDVGKREVEKGLQAADITSVIEEQTRLPSTHRHGFGSRTDDVAEGADGMPTKVPTPENPDDRFS